jgi:hypothetical protein
MNYTNTSRIDILTNLDRERNEEKYLRGSGDNVVNTTDKLIDKFVQENLKCKVKFGLSVLYFVSLVYFTIILFI